MLRAVFGLVPVLSLAGIAVGQPAFSEEAVARGLAYVVTDDIRQFGAGCALIDLDEDGDPDCVLLGRSDGQVGVYENDGTGHFINRSTGSGIAPASFYSAVAGGDYDNDGDLDLYISRFDGFSDKLYRNNGDFTFTDVSSAAGILSGGMGMGIAWADYDLDGFLDLYVTNRTTTRNNTVKNRLYHNRGDGTFEEVAIALGVADDDAPTLLCAWLDYDEDGDADLYLGTDKGTGSEINRLFQNQGDGTFVDVTAQTNTEANVDCMGIGVGDFDLDGWKDLYVTNTPPGNVLLMADGQGAFVDRTLEADVGSYETGWGCQFLDFDHDMILELYVCNMQAANRLYRHDGQFPTADVAAICGVDDGATSYCMALADVDMDGDIDLLVQSDAVNVRLYINNEGQRRNWVKLNVVGQGANRHAVGATLKVDAGGVVQTREIHAGANYKSDNERVVQLGLADEPMIDAIHVLWPGGTTRTVRNMTANETWTIYPPERLGDGDNDGDIDARDWALASQCYTGPGPGNMRPGCEVFDMDGDGDVDMDDILAMGGRLLRNAGPRP